MQTYSIFPLRFENSLHLSRGREDNFDKSQAILHSDTLKSALFVSEMTIQGNVPNQSFLSNLELSSLFPYYRTAEKTLFFLPKPILPNLFKKLRIKDVNERKQRKTIKQIEYIEFDLLLDILQKGAVYKSKENISKDGAFISNDISLENIELFSTHPQQHVAVDRLYETDANPFFVDRLYFHQNVGLYFLTPQPIKNKEKMLRLLEFLGETGLGTDKTIGGGHFSIDQAISNQTIALPTTGNAQINLSLYCPDMEKKQELADLEKSYFELVKRGGYITFPENPDHLSIRKRSVYMFKEGSIFPYLKNREGAIVNLQPDANKLKDAGINNAVEHEIWRDGRSIFLAFDL